MRTAASGQLVNGWEFGHSRVADAELQVHGCVAREV